MGTPQQIGLFEGYGGLSRAVTNTLGAELIAYSEIEPAACRVQEHHNPDVPNLGDITQIDWSQVKRDSTRSLIVTGGFPCTDLSPAGLREGLRPGTRSGLWTHMAYAIDQIRPDLVIVENVRGILSADAACNVEPCPWCLGDNEGRPLRALGAVLGDLANLGYHTEWVGLRASDPPVEAPHERYRVFVAAYPHGAGLEGHRRPVRGTGEKPAPTGAAQVGSRFPWAEYTDAIRTWERRLGRPAPDPVDDSGEESPMFAEWMMGLPLGHVTGVPGLSRSEQLKLLGNGVLPAQAEAALLHMLAANVTEKAA